MRIAFVTPAYYPAIIGASFYCQTLAEGLAKKGHDIEIYTNAPMSLKKQETINGIKVRRFYPKVMGSYYISSGMFSAILGRKYDIIHSHHFGYYPATAGLLAAKLRKTKHVFGPYYHPPIYGRKRSFMFAAYHLSQGMPLLRMSDRVLPHTEFEKRMLLKIGGKEDSMELLPNAVDTERFSPGKKKKENIVLFVANLIEEKGARIALDMAENLAEKMDSTFVFIGNPVEHGLFPYIERLKKTRKALFLKNIPEKELISWYRRASAIILPSRYEAFGKAVAEAQACGTPAVVTKVGGMPAVVKDGETGFVVDYGNWKSFQEKIETILDSPKKARTIGAKARQHVVRNFDSEVIVRKLCRIYENIV